MFDTLRAYSIRNEINQHCVKKKFIYIYTHVQYRSLRMSMKATYNEMKELILSIQWQPLRGDKQTEKYSVFSKYFFETKLVKICTIWLQQHSNNLYIHKRNKR